MKTFYLIPVLGLFLAFQSCNNSGQANTDSSEAQTIENSGEVKAKESSELNNNHKGGAIHLTKDDFLKKVMNYEENPQEWVYLGDKPCIIDFYADWCRPCKIAGPILDELAGEYKDDIYVYKIDTEKERELAAAFGIQSIPAFLFVPQNGNPQMSNGIARTEEETKAMFKQIIDEFLLNKETASN